METPEKFKNLAEAVRNEVYGKDVREAIATSIEKTGASSETAIKITEQLIDGSFDEAELTTEIERRLNQLEEEYAPELNSVKSQLAHESQKINNNTDRINDIENNKADKAVVQSSLNNKRDKSVPITLNDTDPELLAAIEGGEGTEFNLLTIPRDKSVTEEKTTFISVSSNLFDPEKAVSGYIDVMTGELEPHSDYWSTDFIEAKPNQYYTYDRFNRLVYYDKNKTRIGYDESNDRPSTFMSRDDTAYIRLSIEYKAWFDEAYVGEGSVFQFEPHYKRIKDHIEFPRLENAIENFDGKNVINRTLSYDKTDFIEKPSTNLYNRHTTKSNTFIDDEGNEQDSSQNAVSDFIKITPNTTYIMRHSHTTVYYDENKNFRSRPTRTGAFTTPEYAHYVRLMMLNSHVYDEQLNEGDELLPYEDYYVTVDGMPVGANNSGGGGETDPEKKYYFTPEEIKGYYEPSEMQFDDFSHYHSQTSVEDFYNALDGIMVNYPEYMSKKEHGLDESDTYPVYEYTLKPQLVEMANQDKQIPKILIACGLHGEEKMSVFSLYYLVKDICENWKDNPVLNYLRWNVEIKFIPIANPWGFTDGSQGRRKNSNGVDINRNFSYNHNPGDPDSSTYGGTAPFSEKETQYVKSMVDENPDALYFADYHTNGTSGHEYGTLMWFAEQASSYRFENVEISSQYHLSLMTRKFIENYNQPSDEGFFGYMTHSTNGGTAKSYAMEHNIPSNTVECFRKFPSDEEHFNSTAQKAVTEFIGNYLITILKQFKYK